MTPETELAEAERVAVCSARPRPSVQNNHSKGPQWWARDVYHISDGHNFTLCGRSHHDWLTIGPIAEVDHNCCKRCAATLLKGNHTP